MNGARAMVRAFAVSVQFLIQSPNAQESDCFPHHPLCPVARYEGLMRLSLLSQGRLLLRATHQQLTDMVQFQLRAASSAVSWAATPLHQRAAADDLATPAPLCYSSSLDVSTSSILDNLESLDSAAERDDGKAASSHQATVK